MNNHQKHTALLEQMFEASPKTIFVIDKYKIITQVNTMACLFFTLEKTSLVEEFMYG